MTISTPTVSVIVPTFNRASIVSETLNAILPQLQRDDELIVIDDGSEDATPEILSAFGAQIRVIRQDNAGKSGALNNGLKQATGNYVWIVDDDDIVAENARDTLLEPLLHDADAGFSYGRHDRFSVDADTGAVQNFPTGYWIDCEADAFLVHVLEDMFPHQPGMMVRKSLYDKVGPFNSKYDRSEDYEMLIRLAIAAKAVAVTGIIFHQRVHSGTRGSKENPVAASQRDANWIGLGKLIGEEIIATLPMELFIPKREISSSFDERLAILQRGVIYGRHHTWDKAIGEFEAAISMNLGPLSVADRAILTRATQSKFGVDGILIDPSVRESLRALAKRNKEGRELCRTLGHSLKWRLRVALQSAELSNARRLLWTFGRLAYA